MHFRYTGHLCLVLPFVATAFTAFVVSLRPRSKPPTERSGRTRYGGNFSAAEAAVLPCYCW